LQRYRLIEAIPDGYFNRLANIIARTFGVPIALVSLVEQNEVEFPGNFGMTDTKTVSRGLSLCSLAILDDSPTIFNDALKEPCLLTNPLVTGSFGLRFYAGAPILTYDNFAIGTVCVVDKMQREFGDMDKQLLQYFAHLAMQEMETRFTLLNNQEYQSVQS
jgi:GAF domain-containing protein